MEKKEEKKSNSTKKIIKNSFLFVLLIILTYYFIFKKIDRKGINEALQQTNLLFILVACILAAGNIIFESINIYRTLNMLDEKVNFRQALKYGIVGFFFSAITPAATGGQPIQVYYMHKDGIPYTHATVAILIQSFAYLTAMVSLGVIGFIINYDYISDLGFLEYFFFIGLLANSLIILITLIAMFSKRIAKKLVDFVHSIINKFNPDKANSFKEKIEKQLVEYHDSAKFIIKNKNIMIKTIFTAFCQLISYHSIAYFVYLALGLAHLNYFKITSLQSFLYLSVSILPLPGTVGVNETGFSLLYSPLINKNIVDSAMLLTRGVGFYLVVIITGVILLIYSLRKKH